jgi:hypothetical protein
MRAVVQFGALASLLASTVAVGGCTDELDEPWFLDHDRIIAVRATPPRIASGETSSIDALLGKKGADPVEAVPPLGQVISPESLADVLTIAGGTATVTAPDEARLDAARAELGLEAGAPVPLQIGVAFPASDFPNTMETEGFPALKTVYLGEHVDNPTLTNIQINGEDGATLTEVHMGADVDKFRLSVDADNEVAGDDVNWLTSVGTAHDFDLPKAYITIEDEDPLEGFLALVLRLENGGVVWKLWPMTADAPPDYKPPASE